MILIKSNLSVILNSIQDPSEVPQPPQLNAALLTSAAIVRDTIRRLRSVTKPPIKPVAGSKAVQIPLSDGSWIKSNPAVILNSIQDPSEVKVSIRSDQPIRLIRGAAIRPGLGMESGFGIDDGS